MHFLDRYALSCGVKISEPFLFEKPFPLPIDKYITFHPYSKQSKTYDYFADVIDLIKPFLDKAGITIVQIQAKDEKPIPGCYHTGHTSIAQVAYLIRNGLLHFGVDSFPVHIASGLGKKIVALYSNNHIECVKPYFTNQKDYILLEPERNGNKPNFTLQEMPKTINTIKPELIANSILKLLGLGNVQRQSIYIGPHYHTGAIESIPNGVLNVQQMGIGMLTIRMDFQPNEDILAQQITLGPVAIVADKPFNLSKITTFRRNVKNLIFELKNEWHDPEFIKDAQSLGIQTTLYTYETNEEIITKFKKYYLDYGIIHRKTILTADSAKELKGKNLSEFKFRCNKFTISNGKIYSSLGLVNKDISVPNMVDNSVNIPMEQNTWFWKDLEHFYIFKD
jgi:hypothetical protein